MAAAIKAASRDMPCDTNSEVCDRKTRLCDMKSRPRDRREAICDIQSSEVFSGDGKGERL